MDDIKRDQFKRELGDLIHRYGYDSAVMLPARAVARYFWDSYQALERISKNVLLVNENKTGEDK